MSVYDSVLLSIIQMAQETSPYANITIGPLPPDNGLSVMWGAGGPTEIYMDKNTLVEIPVILNGKNTDQQFLSETLGSIHKNLSRRKWYPMTNGYQIVDINTSTAPQYVGREENSQWLYGSALRVKFYDRGE